MTIMLTLIPVFTLLIGIEIYIYRRRGLVFPYADAMVSLSMWLCVLTVAHFVRPLLVSINGGVFSLRLASRPMNTAWEWVAIFLLVEFFYYWQHRAAHTIRWLWASHSAHHSTVSYTLTGAQRLAITQLISGLFIFFFPLYILGFNPDMVATVFELNLIYQFWLHTDLVPKLGWFEWIFNTPSLHRVHHATNDIYLDKNYGGVLIIFDRLFGTYQVELAAEPCRYGLVGRSRSFNPLRIFFQDWLAICRDLRHCRTVRAVLHTCFAHPKAFRHEVLPMAASHSVEGERPTRSA